ncbi:fusaric acid cluster transcription factor FUB10 [Trichoderma asperellum]|uniref:Fusaric acid cluster transcription factor FUB10 n=1 Tax=Trichoderma asperellum TaxID=101201 RepID=A0A6V8R1G7_TRIAP|nr:fusaric acid cluster transcription factor FUB10 [Trichoderma asperellum]
MSSGIAAAATAAATAQAASAPGPQKHRACDECRFRKIACSKEPGGCSRCQKEGITCVYSPQKPMGRPRKRRHAQSLMSVSLPMPASAAVTAPESTAALDAARTSTIAEALARVLPPAQAATVSVGAPSAYLGVGQHGQNLSHGDQSQHHCHQHNTAAHQHNHCHPPQPAVTSDLAASLLSQPLPSDISSYLALSSEYNTDDFPRHSQGFFDGAAMPVMNLNQADLFESISFDETETDSSASSMSKDFNDSLQKYMVSQYLDPPPLSESSPSTSTHSSCFASPKPHPTASCDCLASLTQALSSLNRLPADVISAMQVARGATKIAYDTLSCVYCYGDIYDLSKPSPVSRFQSMMCLGALVPSACNAYATILEMVDRDVERAKGQLQSIYFNFKEVGGIWGNLIDEKSPASPECALLRSFHDRYLDPETWKATIRAILKVEVYGFNQKTASVSSTVDCSVSPYAFLHCGLKDVITLLDEKNQKRHDIADALLQANHALPGYNYLLTLGAPKPCPREERHCVRMLDVARMALSNLVIS